MTYTQVAKATLRGQHNGRWSSVTWRFTRHWDGSRTRWSGPRTGNNPKSKDFGSRAHMQNYLQWLTARGWRVEWTGVMPPRPVKVKQEA